MPQSPQPPEQGGVDAAPAHTRDAPASGNYGGSRSRVRRAAPGSAEPSGEAPASGAPRSAAPSPRRPPSPRARAHCPSPTQPRRSRARPPAAARRSPPRRRTLPLPGVPGGRGGGGGGGGASLTAQRLRAAPGPRGAPGIFFWETSPGSVGLSRPGRKNAQRREAATIRELRGDVNPPPQLPVPPSPLRPRHMWTRREAAAGPSRSPLGAAPAPPASEALRPAASGPPEERGESGVLGGWGSWVPPSPPLRGEGMRPWGPGRASAEERDLEGSDQL
ncbi:uncharacterized protein [Callorhinus ursinus]|uniref:uncharacterized protein n=1 Tax=Callorhinus ursinus TaxID=34884 RepID=UPI003CD04EE9